MKRTVCVLVPLVCGFSLTRIDFPRDSHPSRSCLLGNPLQCRGKSRQGLCLLGDSYFLSQPASFLSRCTFPLLCSHEAKGHFSTSRPTHSLRVATRNKTSCLPSTSKKVRLGKSIPNSSINSPTRLPRLKSPRPPTPKCATPQHQPPLLPCREAAQCTMRYSISIRLAATMVSQGTSWAHRYSCRAAVWYLEEPCLRCDTHCTHMLSHPSLPPWHM